MRPLRRGGLWQSRPPTRLTDPIRGGAGGPDVRNVLGGLDHPPQLVNSVIEEKMSKISEVLLGSLTPFELMMGKLLGNTGIGMVLATLYSVADTPSPPITATPTSSRLHSWPASGVLVVAILLYGSLYMSSARPVTS